MSHKEKEKSTKVKLTKVEMVLVSVLDSLGADVYWTVIGQDNKEKWLRDEIIRHVRWLETRAKESVVTELQNAFQLWKAKCLY